MLHVILPTEYLMLHNVLWWCTTRYDVVGEEASGQSVGRWVDHGFAEEAEKETKNKRKASTLGS